MSIPKLNGIAANYVRLASFACLSWFVRFSEDGGPSGGKTEAIFSRYTCQPPAEGAPTLAPGPLCTNRLYVQGHLKSHIHMYNAA